MMYLGIDIGGTKTLVATLDSNGVIQEKFKFPTPDKYSIFLTNLAKVVANLSTKEFLATGVGVPGKIDRDSGVAIAFGNLSWRNLPIQHDISKITHSPVVIENDANLAGLSEAMLVKDRFDKVLYVTVSTGIGTGIITHGSIDPEFADSEGGLMMIEHDGKLQQWEDFASGKAIVQQYGKQAHDIHDSRTWKIISKNIADGLLDLIPVIQPEIIIIGGGVGSYYSRFSRFLKAELNRYKNPLMPIPTIIEAGRPEDAVVYGCFDLAKARYG